MADNKHISIRIKDKYDSITNWLTKWDSFVPLEGEVCVIHIPTGTSEANLSSIGVSNKITNLPVDLIKVGDGTSNIGALPFTTSGSADKLATPRTIKLKGDVTGSGSFDGSADLEITATVADNSHAHSISDITNLQDTLDSKAPSSHPHDYAGSTSAGGPADSANKLNTNAGSTTQPVYFKDGVPKKTTYTLEASVPSGAKFTDTDTKVTSVSNHYTPATDTTAELSADADSTTAATWGVTDLVTGVNIQRDAKGHVTGVTVDSVQMPANPDTNTALTITNKSSTDTTDLVYAVTNLVEGGTKGHSITPTYTGVPTKDYVDKLKHDHPYIPNDEKGVAMGVATLDSNGKVPTSQLPSYVDDVIEGYLYNSKFYKESAHTTVITGETGKIYVDLSNNKTYRWSGSAFTEISASLALGETSSTAYYGDKGKVAYTHSQSAHAPSNAEKNQNAFSNVAVSGQTTVSADTTTDTLTLAAGANVTITTDATNDKITIASQDTNTTYDLAATKSSTNGNTKLNLTAGGSGSGTDSVTIKGTGGTTVTTDANGVVTVNSTTTASKLGTADVGSATHPIYLEDGTPKETTYTLGKSVPSDAVFTDTHNSHAIISGTKADGTTIIQGAASSGNITLGDSGVTAGEYGPTANATPGYGSTFNVPDIKVNSKGIVTSIVNRTVKIPASDNTNQTVKVGTTTFGANDAVSITAGSNVTVTPDATNKKITIASSHPTVTKETNTTSTASPAHGGTFTAIDGVTTDDNGHVTKINTKTVTLPTDTKVTQTSTTVNAKHPLMLTANASPSSGGAGTSIYNTNIYAKFTAI